MTIDRENETPGEGDLGPATDRWSGAPPARTRKSAERRQAILQRAAELFDRKGYANTSLDDVAKAVGIKREAVYYYYKNRAEILLAIIGPQSLALIEGLREIAARDAAPQEKLRLAIRNHLHRFDRHCLEMTVSLRDGLFEASHDVRSEMQRIWKEYEQLWIALILEGQDSGAFEKLGDPKMIAFAVLGMCNWLARWYNPRKSASIDEIIETYTRLVTVGLVPRAPG